MEISRNKERDADPQPQRGARPKETWHRFRLSVTGRNGESQNDNRTELEDEFLPNRGGFMRRNQLPRDSGLPRQRRKIVPLREPSLSSGDHSPPPLSSIMREHTAIMREHTAIMREHTVESPGVVESNPTQCDSAPGSRGGETQGSSGGCQGLSVGEDAIVIA